MNDEVKREPPSWCTNFRSMKEHQTCAAGVPYGRFVNVHHDHKPCFLIQGQPMPGAVDCEELEPPSKEGMAAYQALRDLAAEGTPELDELVVQFRTGHLGKHETREFPCPICRTGTLKLEAVDPTEHIRAKCSTAGCVRWVR